MKRTNALALVVVALMPILGCQTLSAEKDERQKTIEVVAKEIEELALP